MAKNETLQGSFIIEDLSYGKLRNSGALPIVGTNTFLGSDGSPISTAKDVLADELVASSRRAR